MNQKQWTISSSRAKNLNGKSERSGDFLRRMFVRILLGAQHGHFLLKENGSVVAEVGDRNDCLKAGIAYRREFYTDRDIEPANSVMFTISIVPFAEINSPNLSK